MSNPGRHLLLTSASSLQSAAICLSRQINCFQSCAEFQLNFMGYFNTFTLADNRDRSGFIKSSV